MIKSYFLAWLGDVNIREKQMLAPGGADAR